MCVSFWVIFFPVTGLMGQKMLLTVLWFSNYLFTAYASVSLHVKWGQVAPFIAGLWQRVDKPPRLASSEQLQRMLTAVVLLVGNACPGIFFCSDVLLIKLQKECLTARANGFPHMPKAFVQMIWSCIITCLPDYPYPWLVKVLDLVRVTITSSTYSEP